MNKEQIKAVALDMIEQNGLINLSRADLCEKVGIANGSFVHVMGCTFTEFIEDLKQSVVETGEFKVNKIRVNPELRKDQILNIALELSKHYGYNNITRDDIRKRAGVSAGLVSKYFNTMTQLRRTIMRAAIHKNIPEIIAQGLANNDDHAKKAPPELKKQAAQLIANY